MKIYAILFLVLVSSICFITTSCNQCKDVNCQNGGTCSKGKCECPTWYEGDMCQVAVRDKMLGTYTGTLKCADEDDMVYDVVITSYAPNAGKITISEQGRAEFQCDLSSANSFKFTAFLNGSTFSYEGTVNGKNLSIIQKKLDGSTVLEECQYTGTKQ